MVTKLRVMKDVNDAVCDNVNGDGGDHQDYDVPVRGLIDYAVLSLAAAGKTRVIA